MQWTRIKFFVIEKQQQLRFIHNYNKTEIFCCIFILCGYLCNTFAEHIVFLMCEKSRFCDSREKPFGRAKLTCQNLITLMPGSLQIRKMVALHVWKWFEMFV